jgi:hypothetical protein
VHTYFTTYIKLTSWNEWCAGGFLEFSAEIQDMASGSLFPAKVTYNVSLVLESFPPHIHASWPLDSQVFLETYSMQTWSFPRIHSIFNRVKKTKVYHAYIHCLSNIISLCRTRSPLFKRHIQCRLKFFHSHSIFNIDHLRRTRSAAACVTSTGRVQARTWCMCVRTMRILRYASQCVYVHVCLPCAVTSCLCGVYVLL